MNVNEGAQVIDVSSLNIYLDAGETLAIQSNGIYYYTDDAGNDPTNEKCYLYTSDNSSNSFQLQVYGAEKYFYIGFNFDVSNETESSLYIQADKNKSEIETLKNEVSFLQETAGFVFDRAGNKYSLLVVGSEIKAVALDFNHVMCVGNSYTTHPTVDDTLPSYKNTFWWGHWSMAASRKETAWTTLLENCLKAKRATARVTPVFGRNYETKTYTLLQENAFTYWEGKQMYDLKSNIGKFADVDCIVFFLGENYSGDGWYDLYAPMVQQFIDWFPNAYIVCCSCASSSSVSKNAAIQRVAKEQSALYISMTGISGHSKMGNYVLDDDGEMHQINYNAVAGHFGDFGEYNITDTIARAIGYDNISKIRNVVAENNSGCTYSMNETRYLKDSIVSLFINSGSYSSISVKGVTVSDVKTTDHGKTDYGRVITFIMPDEDVTVILS